jgi:UDP:flavonoid glycosyltransferase YjiC (YdhE family)
LGTPCVVIPIENHFEQEANAKRFSEKYGFVVLRYDDLNAKSLVDSIKSATSKNYEPPDFSGGAEKAARLILNSVLRTRN